MEPAQASNRDRARENLGLASDYARAIAKKQSGIKVVGRETLLRNCLARIEGRFDA